jgi:hypothetical protein
VPGDPEEPGAGIHQVLRYVVQPPPRDQERLRDHVLGLAVRNPSLGEANQIRVRRLVQRAEP